MSTRPRLICSSRNTSGVRPAVQARRPIRLALPLLLVAGLGVALLHYSGQLDAVSCSCKPSPAAPVYHLRRGGWPYGQAALQMTRSHSVSAGKLST